MTLVAPLLCHHTRSLNSKRAWLTGSLCVLMFTGTADSGGGVHALMCLGSATDAHGSCCNCHASVPGKTCPAHLAPLWPKQPSNRSIQSFSSLLQSARPHAAGQEGHPSGG